MTYTLKEHKEKKLFPKNDLVESAKVVCEIDKENVKQLTESAKGKTNKKLIVKMEAIHVGLTKNFNYYTEEGLKAGLSSWTHPYNKPVLTHHNEYRGEPIGRILNAEFSESTLSGKPGLVFTVEITDPEAMEKVLDGRYQTVSIGASTDKVICNICGKDRTEEWCEHWPGDTYDGQTAHFIIGTTFGREVSYVNTPADEHAGNFSVEVVENDQQTESSKESLGESHFEIFQIAEQLYQSAKHPEVNLYHQLSESQKRNFDELIAQRGEDEMAENEKEEKPESKQENPSNASSQKEEAQPKEKEVNESGSTKVTEDKKTIQEMQAKINQLQELVSKTVLEKTQLEARIKEMENDINTLTEENTQLIAENHKALVEKVVEMKLALRKADVIGVSKEEAIANHMARTRESLSDTLNDLLQEQKNQRPTPGSVKNPGLPEEDLKNEKEETVTLKEATNILANMFGKKRK